MKYPVHQNKSVMESPQVGRPYDIHFVKSDGTSKITIFAKVEVVQELSPNSYYVQKIERGKKSKQLWTLFKNKTGRWCICVKAEQTNRVPVRRHIHNISKAPWIHGIQNGSKHRRMPQSGSLF